MICDFHSHLLPGMDDGAKTVGEALEVLRFLSGRGIRAVCLTPHYVPHRESVDAFLGRRAACAAALAEGIRRDGACRGDASLPRLILGAEVRVEPGLEQTPGLARLAYEGTDRILLELPYRSYQAANTEELCNLCFTHRLRPVVAHPNRYAGVFSDEQMSELLRIPAAVMQFNLEAFRCLIPSAFFRLAAQRTELAFGGDLHGSASLAALGFPRAAWYLGHVAPAHRLGACSPFEKEFLAAARPL